jgi:hypothetical protein
MDTKKFDGSRFPDIYSREDEGRIAHKKLLEQGILDADFGATYFGYFKSKDAFAYFKLYGSNNVCAIPGMDYRDYADEIFKDQFVFEEGHVFWR